MFVREIFAREQTPVIVDRRGIQFGADVIALPVRSCCAARLSLSDGAKS